MDDLDKIAEVHSQATSGKWTSNCAGEIFATIDGEVIRIGHFQGCAVDAEAVCALHNNAQELILAASRN